VALRLTHPEVALRLPPANGLDPFGIIGGGGEVDLSDRSGADRRWRCAYRDPEVALRLPPANGLDPSGIGGGGADDLSDRRWRGPEVALRVR
jgi:hypothetical protein